MTLSAWNLHGKTPLWKQVHCSHMGTLPHDPLEKDDGINTMPTHILFPMAWQQWDKSLWSTEKVYTSASTNVNKN